MRRRPRSSRTRRAASACVSRARSSRRRRCCAPICRRVRRASSSCCAVDRAYPIYGTFALEGGGRYRHDLVAGQGALVRPDLIAQLGLRVGGHVFIGQTRFEIRGVITGEPGRRAGAFSLGPRVVIDRADLAATGLIGFGSRASYQRLLQVPDAPLDPHRQAPAGAPEQQFRVGPLVPRHRSARPGADRGRAALPRPGRLRDPRARRHRRVERDPRLPAAEADQHRRAQVPRRFERAHPDGLRAAGARARPGRQRARPARRRARPAGRAVGRALSLSATPGSG